MNKGLKIGCLSIVGLFVLIVLYFVFEPESWRKERIDKMRQEKDSAAYYAREVTRQMASVRALLPRLTEVSQPLPFPFDSLHWGYTLFTSVEELSHFHDSVYTLTPPVHYGPWLSKPLQTIEDTYDTTRTPYDFEVIKAGKEIFKRPYLMVYQPDYHAQPRVVDDKTFVPGYFFGWMIYVDVPHKKVLGYARLKFTTTLYKIETHKIGVGIDPLPVSIPLFNTTNVKQELEDNFRDQLFVKSDSVYFANRQKSPN